MRIISGIARGSRLDCLSGVEVRPTLDRVRESVFSSIGDLRGLVVADLFAGSGSFGLEALSRGASHAIFIENNRRVLTILRQNIKTVFSRFTGINAVPPSYEIITTEVARVARLRPELAGKIDIMFADPPYRADSARADAATLLQDREFTEWAGKGLLILEHAARRPLPWYPAGLWQCSKTREFGNCAVSFAWSSRDKSDSVMTRPE